MCRLVNLDATATQFFTGRMPNQQRQSSEGKSTEGGTCQRRNMHRKFGGLEMQFLKYASKHIDTLLAML